MAANIILPSGKFSGKSAPIFTVPLNVGVVDDVVEDVVDEDVVDEVV